MNMTDHLVRLVAALDVSGLPRTPADSSTLQVILNTVLAIVGAVSVLMIVIAGIRFITSRGNPGETAKAKNAIVWASIGLLVVIFAGSIVNFVVFRLT